MSLLQRHRRTRSLRTRLVLTVIALLAAVGCVIGLVTTLALHAQLVQQVDDRLGVGVQQALDGRGAPGQLPRGGTATGAVAGTTACTTEGAVQPDQPGRGPSYGRLQAVFDDGQVQVEESFIEELRADGCVQRLTTAEAAALSPLAEDPETVSGEPGQVPGVRTVTLPDGSSYRAVAVQRSDGAVVVVGASLAEADGTLSRIIAVEVVLVTAGVAVAAVLGSVLIRRDLRPLRRVAGTATRVSELPLDRGEVDIVERVAPVDTDPATEVGQVGAAFNRMLDHVGRALSARHASEMQVRQFVADASHELRTPLAAIRGYAELTRRRGAGADPVPEDVDHALRRVESEALRMTGLVDDLLLLARLDAQQPLAAEEVDLTMLVLDAVSDARAASPAHRWHLDLPEDVVTAVGDGHRLHQVLANLLANARTHTPAGTTVTTSVRAATSDAGRPVVVLEVADDGPGIDPSVLPHVFERFARADTSRSRAAGSTGLGLAIVHAVVTAHGGAVSVASVPGRTVFRVELPAAGATTSQVHHS
ncbi:HAMP domain-containing sensor histidine kinase [Kineococcus glutinatus]|uniref:histidine kinase n=1 Tax=Kineococcus glutinatus TaxID=1070872 RepID=A0ABP9HXF1_9ACTN